MRQQQSQLQTGLTYVYDKKELEILHVSERRNGIVLAQN